VKKGEMCLIGDKRQKLIKKIDFKINKKTKEKFDVF